MGDLSKNFSRTEPACPCGCGLDTADVEIVDIAQCLRDEFEVPITIHSGYRCEAYNKRTGGSKKSQHLYGRAWDIYPGGKRTGSGAVKIGNDKHRELLLKMYNWLMVVMQDRGGLAIYIKRKPGKVEFIHIDTRSDGPARWEG